MTRPPHFTHSFEGATIAEDKPLQIKRCKILGMESRWGRKFTDAAHLDAVTRRIYEGLPIYRDHPEIDYSDPNWDKKPIPPRSVNDVIGFVEHIIHVPGEGLFGDVTFTVDDELTRSVVQSARLNPRLYGFSHHAQYESRFEGQLEIVDRILKAHSVDLVTKPATTNGLFEGEPTVSKPAIKTVRQVLESVALVGIAKNVVKALENEPYMAAQVPMETELSVDDQIGAAFRTAGMAIFDDPGMDDSAKLAKLKELFKAKAKLSGKEPETEGDAPPAKKDDEKPKDESAPPTAIGTVEALKLLETQKIPITSSALEAYAGMPKGVAESMAAREAAGLKETEDLKARLNLATTQTPKSISRIPGTTPPQKLEGGATKELIEKKPWLAFCRN